MWPFRRKPGKHELGAAVTAIPSHVRLSLPALPLYEAPAPQPDAAPAIPAYEPPASAAPRVELGFRDGSTAALAPESAQAKALTEIASVLTQRD